MTATVKHITAEQLANGGYDRCELVDGEIIEMAPANFEHGDIALGIGAAIRLFVNRRKLGRAVGAETGFVISRFPDTVLAPDIAFVRRARIRKDRVTSFFEGAPDLAVEVVSPADRLTQVRAEAARWIAAGAESVWIVNPAKRAIELLHVSGAVKRFSGRDVLKDEPTLPGFSLDLSDVFPE